ncbi:MAG: maleylacetoacetate isomerase [Pseudorhodobacter sp.]
MVKLFSYWRSTTSYRVRIALNLKGLRYEVAPIDLVAGEQHGGDYTALNPVGGVPTLILSDGTALSQSMAILDYLDATYPDPALLPRDPLAAAQVRAAAMVIACDIHPVNNLKVGARLREMGHDQAEVVAWMNDWMRQGLTAFARLIRPDTPYCFGDRPGLADLCLIPQLYNAHRWGTDLGGLVRLTDIETRCLDLPAFAAARPEAQPDTT